MHSYTQRPKSGTTARLAWDLFVQERNEKPESVEYSPNYDRQHKGWICNHYVPDPQIKHLGYGGSSHYTFYHSGALISRKETINAITYVEPPEHQPLPEFIEPTAEEIALHRQINTAFTEQVKKHYQQGGRIQEKRDAIFKEHGVNNMRDYLAKHGSHIYSSSTPNNPIVFKYYDTPEQKACP
jgi:hypothetical protein